MLYLLVHDTDSYYSTISPALALSWRRRSLEPLIELSSGLASKLKEFSERFRLTTDEQPLLLRLSADRPFDRRLWRHLAGEVLLYAAADAPPIQTAPDTFAGLLAPEHLAAGATPREQLAPIRQVHFGSRDLDFGGVVYRPDHAGFNDIADVAR